MRAAGLRRRLCVVFLVCFLPDSLDALHQPRGRGRGDKPRAVLRLGGGGRGDRGRGEDAGSQSKAEDWDEERRIAALLGDKIIRKLSMKRWLEERHKFFPTPSAVERLRVEEGEEMRDRILAQEGWPPRKSWRSFTGPSARAGRNTPSKPLRWRTATAICRVST